ncbi:MAG: nucleotidyltransferase family protein, partial [Deltaproteobacteria bacterium]|nr:nucleotidyltransferase family protein [Deltaproteobacteria bacterium]
MRVDAPKNFGPPPLIGLWRQVALGGRGKGQISLGERDVAWAIETGMAPLLVDYLDPGPLAESLKERLQAADLWARYRSAENLAAALEIFDACKGQVPPLTLLKGLSIGPERYPAPHYRFLGDLDLLVPEEALRETQRVLETLGYVASRSAFDGESDHHLPALRHPRTGVVVELHRGLF